MIGGFGSTQIMVSEHAVRRWSERRLRFERYIFRGVTETRARLVTVDCEELAAWQLCGRITMHPVLYTRLRNSPQLIDAKQNPNRQVSRQIERKKWTERISLGGERAAATITEAPISET